jgi:hypothetical protein
VGSSSGGDSGGFINVKLETDRAGGGHSQDLMQRVNQLETFLTQKGEEELKKQAAKELSGTDAQLIKQLEDAIKDGVKTRTPVAQQFERAVHKDPKLKEARVGVYMIPPNAPI